jgi:hypothetical protein
METSYPPGMTADQVQSMMAASGWTTVPSTSTSAGTAGQYAANTSNFFICVATNTWRRVTLEAF